MKKSIIRKPISILLSLLMVLSVCAGMTFTAGAANTYQISSYDDLLAFAAAVNGGETDANAVLTADIIAEGSDWTPIGNDPYYYKGSFDGDRHTITGLSNVSNANLRYAGLFGYVGVGGVVQNVGLVGGSIKGKENIGAVAGYNEGKIINCYNTSAVTATDNNAYVGGVVGLNRQGTVQNCYNTGSVSGADADAGGVVGYSYSNSTNKKAIVANCYNTGEVTGGSVGGIVGENGADYGGRISISNCFNTGKISGAYNVGGVAASIIADGYYCTIDVTNCYYDGDVCTVNNGVGTKLTTAQMTGMDALTNMPGLVTDTWLQKANIETEDGSTWFYPHLKGFAYDATCAVEDWPAVRIVLTELGKAKAAAKAELENYIAAIDPADYRPAQQTELNSAVSNGKAAIDAAADIDAVNAALVNAKAAIDAIKTDAELTADENAAAAVEDLIDAIGPVEYTDESKAKIDAARDAYDALTADQQALVMNYVTLTDAEDTYAELEAAAEALADAKADLRDAVAEAKAYYDTIKHDEKYAQIADDLDTAIQQGEAALNSDDIAEVTGMTERVQGVLSSVQQQKAVIDAQPDTPDEPTDGCAICGATTHDPNWVGIVHAVLIFVRALLVEVLPLIIELAQ